MYTYIHTHTHLIPERLELDQRLRHLVVHANELLGVLRMIITRIIIVVVIIGIAIQIVIITTLTIIVV